MRREQLTGHPDQVRWNAKYAEDPPAPRPHRLARQALAMDLPDGPVADLACGPSGSARRITLLARKLRPRERRSRT